jgi:hypothetical protein
MLPPDTKYTTSADRLSDEHEMARYGIERVPFDHFHYRQFRYINLRDAIAQARRDEKTHELGSACHDDRRSGT